jgi:hypothetical protein
LVFKVQKSSYSNIKISKNCKGLQLVLVMLHENIAFHMEL